MVFFGYKNGAEGQNRTAHTGIFSPLLYQLSYLGTTRGKLHIFLPIGKHFFQSCVICLSKVQNTTRQSQSKAEWC